MGSGPLAQPWPNPWHLRPNTLINGTLNLIIHVITNKNDGGFELDAKTEQIIVDVLVERLSPFLIVLFGSSAKGTAHQGSDIDIGFHRDVQHSDLDSYDLFLLSQEIAAKIGKDVDLVDLHKVSTVFQAQILHTGKVIYCNAEDKKARFEMVVLKKYAKLNEERSHILKKIHESGIIYEK
ncbi:nucleotidyltransferase domain-containing protein [Bacillus infantis]|nr:nucleotidyltransferase domain-containing protein [Bacillus infantis]